jgi:hypothetical protein
VFSLKLHCHGSQGIVLSEGEYILCILYTPFQHLIYLNKDKVLHRPVETAADSGHQMSVLFWRTYGALADKYWQ